MLFSYTRGVLNLFLQKKTSYNILCIIVYRLYRIILLDVVNNF
jgi:hypothetical protein